MYIREETAGTKTPRVSYKDTSPLTPPPSDEKTSSALGRIFSTIKQYKRGQLASDPCWLTFKIGTTERTELEQRLSEDGFCQDKLHWGYFPLQRLFVIRMPTTIHELFLVKVHNDIQSQLSSFTTGPSADFAKDIEFFASSKFNPIDPNYGPHDPDGSFGHTKEWFPGVIIEAAYSQKTKMLGRLAEEYIFGSDLNVRVMVGFDIEYKKKKVTFTVWRPQLQRREDGEEEWILDSKTEIIRHADGTPNNEPEAGLRLHLRDFASVEFCEKFSGDIDGTIFLPCTALYSYITEVESVIATRVAPEGPNPLLRKRKRSPTPEEELDTDDEESFAMAEERAAKRVDQHDTSYEDSLSAASDNS